MKYIRRMIFGMSNKDDVIISMKYIIWAYDIADDY